MEELAAGLVKKPLTGILAKPLISLLRRSIRRRAGYDIYQSDPLSAAESSFIPALFGEWCPLFSAKFTLIF